MKGMAFPRQQPNVRSSVATVATVTTVATQGTTTTLDSRQSEVLPAFPAQLRTSVASSVMTMNSTERNRQIDNRIQSYQNTAAVQVMRDIGLSGPKGVADHDRQNKRDEAERKQKRRNDNEKLVEDELHVRNKRIRLLKITILVLVVALVGLSAIFGVMSISNK